MDGYNIGFFYSYPLKFIFRIFYHKMQVEWYTSKLAKAANIVYPKTKIGDKSTIHHINMEILNTLFLENPQCFLKVNEI